MPSPGPDAWKQFLAQPDLQWARGYSARTLAHSWEAGMGALPPEVNEVLGGNCSLLLALPEHKVPLPGGRRDSQSDVFALVRRGGTTIAVTVEGKVNEPFGPTIGEWYANPGPGRVERLEYLAALFGRSLPLPVHLRYQLFHRTAAAIIEARRFKTDCAAMVVHSFSQDHRWFGDFVAFAEFLGATPSRGVGATIQLPGALPLTLGWATGDPKFLIA